MQDGRAACGTALFWRPCCRCAARATRSATVSGNTATLTKGGDLRYNNRLFFYQNGSTIVLARMKDITVVNEQKTESVRHRTRYCVRVRIGLQTVDIETKKSNMAALKEDILEKRRQA